MENFEKKISYYTHLFSYSDGLRLAFNALTGNLIELKGNNGNIIETLLTSSNKYFQGNSSEQELLTKLGFLIDNDINELNVVREIFRMGRRKQGPVILTILPTLDCNFRCPYCFERHTKKVMSKEVQNALVKFLRTLFSRQRKSLSIEWFGGEPLLALPVIESLTLKFKEICSGIGINDMNAGITTNGYLLTHQNTTRLMALGVKSAQVTIDGPPEVHNRRRPLSGGKGSFAKILENLKNLPKEFKVNIRINVDGSNKDYIFELLELLHKNGIIPKATAYIANVESFSDRCNSPDIDFLTSEQFEQLRNELMKRCQKAGIPWFSYDSPMLMAYRFCIVDQPKGFVVQPDGKLLKCWGEAGNDTGTLVAHLLNEESWKHISRSSLQCRNPFEDEDCCQCKVLPVCMGGCPRIRENHIKQGIKLCPPLRYSLADEVRALYSVQTQAG